MTKRSRMSLILDRIGAERPELFSLGYKRFVYPLASTIFNQSALDLAKIYITIRSWISLIMGLIGLEKTDVICP